MTVSPLAALPASLSNWGGVSPSFSEGQSRFIRNNYRGTERQACFSELLTFQGTRGAEVPCLSFNSAHDITPFYRARAVATLFRDEEMPAFEKKALTV